MKILLFVAVWGFLLSCHHDSESSVPEGILEEEPLAALLLDMHLYEGTAYQQRSFSQDSIRKLQAYFTKAILAKHNISDSLYQQSLQYYELHPVRFQRVYTKILDSLKEQQKTSP